MENTKKVWKDIPKYEGLYQCSSFGNVKRIDVYSKGINLKSMHKHNSIRAVFLSKDGRLIYHPLHILVAVTFLDYEEKIASFKINHINGQKWDCRVINLELIQL